MLLVAFKDFLSLQSNAFTQKSMPLKNLKQANGTKFNIKNVLN